MQLMPSWILRCSPTGAERRIFLSTQRPDKGNELKCRNDESGGKMHVRHWLKLISVPHKAECLHAHPMAEQQTPVKYQENAEHSQTVCTCSVQSWETGSLWTVLGAAATAALFHMLHFTALKLWPSDLHVQPQISEPRRVLMLRWKVH